MDIAAILRHAKELGFDGFGGRCGEAAVAIDRVLLSGKGELVGAFNAAFLDCDRLIGHVAVRIDGIIWDADAMPKALGDIETWGMLDTEDTDYREAAQESGIDWDDEAAEAVEIVTFDSPEEVLERFGSENLEAMCALLERAKALAADEPEPPEDEPCQGMGPM